MVFFFIFLQLRDEFEKLHCNGSIYALIHICICDYLCGGVPCLILFCVMLTIEIIVLINYVLSKIPKIN